MLRLRRGTVLEADDGPEQQVLVELADGRHPAVADVRLVGRCEPGDEVVVNVAARELKLGSGGFDVVHLNLTRGLDAPPETDAHVMKLNYSSLQHTVVPVEGAEIHTPAGGPVGVIGLHGQLAPLAWAFAQARNGAKLGYIQSEGGALPGSHSRDARRLRGEGLLAAQITVSPCFGGSDGEAMSMLGALNHGLGELGWDAAVCGPGPGIVGSSSALGHGGMAAFDSAHAALALGARVLIAPRMSSADRRERHRGISHHTRTVLELLLAPVTVALPADAAQPEWGERHDWQVAAVDLDGYAASGLPALTMGRTLAEDPMFFAAALAAGTILAGL